MSPIHALLASVVLLSSLPARAQVLVNTGFETPAFQPGLPVDGQDGWVGLFGPGLTRVTEDAASSGRNSVALRASELAFARPGLVAATFGKDLFFDPVAAGRPVVRIQTDVRLDGADTGEGPEADLCSANLFVANEFRQTLGGFFVSSNGSILAFGRAGQELPPVPYTGGAWAKLELVMDFEAGTIAYGVDGRTVGVLELDPLHTLRSTMLWTAALELVCIDEPEVLDRSRYAAFFDNQLILALPGEAAR